MSLCSVRRYLGKSRGSRINILSLVESVGYSEVAPDEGYIPVATVHFFHWGNWTRKKYYSYNFKRSDFPIKMPAEDIFVSSWLGEWTCPPMHQGQSQSMDWLYWGDGSNFTTSYWVSQGFLFYDYQTSKPLGSWLLRQLCLTNTFSNSSQPNGFLFSFYFGLLEALYFLVSSAMHFKVV